MIIRGPFVKIRVKKMRISGEMCIFAPSNPKTTTMMEANDKGQVSHPISYYWNLVKDLDDTTKLELIILLADSLRDSITKAGGTAEEEDTRKDRNAISDKIYPLTVVADRYGGCYSKGKYLAFNLFPWDVPREIEGSDVECGGFWWSKASEAYTVGKGNTVNDAVEDLKRLLDEKL